MSKNTDPRRRDRTRPLELIGLAAIFAVFVGGIVMLVTRLWLLAIEFAGATFIVALVVLAMLLLAVGPISGGVDEDGPVDGELEPDPDAQPPHGGLGEQPRP